MGRYFLWHIHDKIVINFLLDDHFADDTSVHCSTIRGFLISEKTMLWNLIIPLLRESLGPVKHPKKHIGNDAWKLQEIGINLRVRYFFGHNHLAKPVDMVNVP